tara:strand:+ start:890 stop:1066 length:177 start_codon:yes stop_codon:yes gene_type:complete
VKALTVVFIVSLVKRKFEAEGYKIKVLIFSAVKKVNILHVECLKTKVQHKISQEKMRS